VHHHVFDEWNPQGGEVHHERKPAVLEEKAIGNGNKVKTMQRNKYPRSRKRSYAAQQQDNIQRRAKTVHHRSHSVWVKTKGETVLTQSKQESSKGGK